MLGAPDPGSRAAGPSLLIMETTFSQPQTRTPGRARTHVPKETIAHRTFEIVILTKNLGYLSAFTIAQIDPSDGEHGFQIGWFRGPMMGEVQGAVGAHRTQHFFPPWEVREAAWRIWLLT